MSWVRGKAKKFNGEPIDYVLLFDWGTGQCIGKAVPDTGGNWEYDYYNNLSIGITYVADGCEPIAHGAYQLTVINQAPFVQFVGSVNSSERSSGTATINLTIPSSVQSGDILVLGIMRRSELTISDTNSGVWNFDAGVFEGGQGASIYHRVAKAGDAGKVISVATAGAGRLIAYLSIYRGTSKPLEVVSTFNNPTRYDGTYSQDIKSLAPVRHEGGFMVRVVSTLFALGGTAAKMTISDMSNLGPQSGEPYRLQVAYKHLPTSGILKGVTYDTGFMSGNTSDYVYDVGIILQEISL